MQSKLLILAITVGLGGCEMDDQNKTICVGPQVADITNVETGLVYHYERGVTPPFSAMNSGNYTVKVISYYNEPCGDSHAQ